MKANQSSSFSVKRTLSVNLVRKSLRVRDRLETLDRFVVVPDPIDSRSGDLPVRQLKMTWKLNQNMSISLNKHYYIGWSKELT